jgi:HEAT repeat protein
VSDALDDAVPLVRHAAVLALAHLGSRVADPKLAQLADTDPDPQVRQAARRACHRRTLQVRHQ